MLVDDPTYSSTNWTEIDTGLIFSDTYCRYTAIPDANFEAALEALGYDDISSDGQVPTALIEVVTSLDVSDESISNLTGIESFTALVDLNVQDNGLFNLNLSNNLLLEDVNCSGNKFVYLDLSNNLALNSLYADNGWLSELDVSANTNLQYLYLANNNYLNYLNYKNGNNTNTLFFNTTGCVNLNCIVVDDAAYSVTNWTNIDAANNFSDTYCRYTTIPDANFEVALTALGYDDVASDGQVPTALIEVVTSLDVSNKNIANLTGIRDFEALTALDCSNNQLTEIEFGSNVPLTYLDISSNSLTFLEAPDSIENLLANNNNLVFLDLTDHAALQELSVDSNALKYLNIQNGANANIYNFIATNNADLTCILVDDVAYSTTNWTQIDGTTEFSLTYCKYTQIPDVNFEARLEAIGLDDISADGQVPTGLIIDVQHLDLNFTNSGAIYDLTGIQDFASLLFLSLNDNLMTSVDLSSNTNLSYLFAENTALTSLDLSANPNIAYFYLNNNSDLSSLNIQSGNNTNMDSPSDVQLTNVPNLTCVLVDDETYATTTWTTHVDAQITFNETNCNIYVFPKVYLQGAALNPTSGEESLMRDDLRKLGYLSTTSPYADAVTCNSSVFNLGGTSGVGAISDDIVDWVWVELRDETDNAIVIDSQSALLQRDGDIVAIDGVSALSFAQNTSNYYIVIKHRNHLGIMSASTIALSSTTTAVNFSNDVNLVLGGINTLIDLGSGIYAISSGDYDSNGQVQNSDISAVIQLIGGSGYSKADMDMNGQVQNSDINEIINVNVGKGQQF